MRSKLFVPGSRPELFSKALASAADGISIDLEDAVQEDRKAEARHRVGEYLCSPELTTSSKTIIVRVNALTTVHFESDVAAVAWPALDLLNLPMTESVDDVRAAAALLARYEKERGIAEPIAIMPNIESPRGLRRAVEIATADPRVTGLQLGLGDLFEPLGIARTDTAAIHHVQFAVRVAAGEAGIWALDGAFAAIADAEGYRKEAQAACRLGYQGKTCIHPSQIAIANDVFRPSDKEIAHSLRVVEAAHEAHQKGIGAFMVDGKMIDRPFIKRAEAVVTLAKRLGLAPNS